jgi:hypothetical protein
LCEKQNRNCLAFRKRSCSIITRSHHIFLRISSWLFHAGLLPLSSFLKMEAVCSSELSVDFHRTARLYIPGDRTLYSHCCEGPRTRSSTATANVPKFISADEDHDALRVPEILCVHGCLIYPAPQASYL